MPSLVSQSIDFALVGGHPCLDFINTEIVIHGERVDLLADLRRVSQWFVISGLLPPDIAAAITANLSAEQQAHLLRQVRSLRTELRQMVAQIVAGETIAATTVIRLNDLLAMRTGYLQIQLVGQHFERAFVTLSAAPAQMLALLAESAANLLVNTDFALIKHCSNPDCVRYFYDTTKNHSRRWCSMDGCGNRQKVAAYYERKRQP